MVATVRKRAPKSLCNSIAELYRRRPNAASVQAEQPTVECDQLAGHGFEGEGQDLVPCRGAGCHARSLVPPHRYVKPASTSVDPVSKESQSQ